MPRPAVVEVTAMAIEPKLIRAEIHRRETLDGDFIRERTERGR